MRMQPEEPYVFERAKVRAKKAKSKPRLVGRLGNLLVVERRENRRWSLEETSLVGLILTADSLLVMGQWRHNAPPKSMRKVVPPIVLQELTLAGIMEAIGER